MTRQRLALVGLGIILGALLGMLVTERSVDAQVSYTECGFLTIPGASNGADLAGRAPERPIRIAPGWTPIGGGQYRDSLPGVVVCR